MLASLSHFATKGVVLMQVLPSDVGANLPWNFAFKRSFWRPNKGKRKREADANGSAHDCLLIPSSDKAVSIQSLRKVFETTDGSQKAAVDGLTLDVDKEEITALLGSSLSGPHGPILENNLCLL